MPRKHLIASGISKKNQQNAKTLMKIAKEIKAAAKIGGTNLEANPRLKSAVEKAFEFNLSKESIEKNIHGSEKNKDLLLDQEYEIYAFNGLGIIIKAVTDNANRTISNIRKYMTKIDGEIAKQNSVKTNFIWKGEFIIDKKNLDELILLEKLSNFKYIEDLIENEDCFQLIVNPDNFYQAKDDLKNVSLNIIESHLTYIPNWYVDLNNDQFLMLEKFSQLCEEDDDIQWIVTNLGEVK